MVSSDPVGSSNRGDGAGLGVPGSPFGAAPTPPPTPTTPSFPGTFEVPTPTVERNGSVGTPESTTPASSPAARRSLRTPSSPAAPKKAPSTPMRTPSIVGSVATSEPVVAGAKLRAEKLKRRATTRKHKAMARRSYGCMPVQDYDDVVERCKEEDVLWEDPYFTPTDDSLFFSKKPDEEVVWKRPREICDDPQLFVDGVSRLDVQQGELGDCWLLSAIAGLTLLRDSFEKVIPADQSFNDDDYVGAFRFCFWQYGAWIEVVIDDKLPTIDGELVFLRSPDSNEFWCPLLEKAYAKLFGSYEALQLGNFSEAMEDFTGGVSEVFLLSNPAPNLWQTLTRAREKGAAMSCFFNDGTLDVVQPNGLLSGHAYSVTGMVTLEPLDDDGEELHLLRILNVWGNDIEWNGAWSDGSPEWETLDEVTKKELDVTFGDDGEFWMSFQDFLRHFTILELVTLGVETDSYQEDADDDEDDDHRDDKFEVFYEHGSWTRHVNAGGCKNFVDTFWTNPQYAFSLEEPDDNCAEGLCTCIIALMQKDRRRYLKQGLSFHSIGFALYDAGSGDDDHDDEGDPARRRDSVFDQQWFRDNAPNAVSMFCKSREVSLRLRLKPGDYVIIPSTFRPNEEANFILRVFTAKKPVEHHLRDNMDTSVRVVDDIRMSRQRRVKRHTGFRRRRVSRDILDSSLDLIAENEEDEDDDVYDDPATMSSTATTTATATRTLRRAADREAQLRRLFRSAADEPEERLDAFALKEVLHQAFKKESWFMKFSAETSKTLMALADEEFVGKIDYEQFSLLWTTVLKAKDIFVEFDRQQQGSMEGFELRKALSSLGFQISLDTFKILVLRYGDREGRVHFEDFLQCVAKLKRLMRQDEKMSTHSVRLCGKIMIDRECFMNAVLYT